MRVDFSLCLQDGPPDLASLIVAQCSLTSCQYPTAQATSRRWLNYPSVLVRGMCRRITQHPVDRSLQYSSAVCSSPRLLSPETLPLEYVRPDIGTDQDANEQAAAIVHDQLGREIVSMEAPALKPAWPAPMVVDILGTKRRQVLVPCCCRIALMVRDHPQVAEMNDAVAVIVVSVSVRCDNFSVVIIPCDHLAIDISSRSSRLVTT
jgi:hypothetical protein